ncbi:hypothetical protein EIP86_001088 [Pleurotus ostreatoroseus]|nr:hypothetical protein EIP86_001088 [Pleurotus ostreatoroseus]
MASTASGTPSLTPSRSPSPEPPIQPDHFYGNESQTWTSPNVEGRTWLDPDDDPLAQRGIPVFKPTMEQFRDFEAFMNKIERWGSKSGIVKVVPPKEWTDALPPLNTQLADVKLKDPIEQQMMGRGGLFRQQNIERRRVMSVREWAELCAQDDLRAPGVDDIGLHARSTNGTVKPKTRRAKRKTRESETAEPEMAPIVVVKEEDEDAEHIGISVSHVVDENVEAKSLSSPHDSALPEPASVTDDVDADDSTNEPHPSRLSTPAAADTAETSDAKEEHDEAENKPLKRRGRRVQTKEEREAALAERAEKDKAFLEDFDPHVDWLPPNTSKFDYTPEFCKELERRYWRNCGFGKAPWYGADMQGSLFTDETQAWNVAHLESTLSRLLPSSAKGLPGVNTPYLYFGMWRATFAWHVEDMDLFSINYIHFGAPKFWYAVPQARAGALEQTMKGYFPKDTDCPQFLRHKSYLASPKVLTQASCRPNFLVQQEGEFVITYPRGYHAGFNLGFNCAESVNFALDSWLDKGRVAKVCECVDFSVRIDVDQLLLDRESERIREQTKATAVQDDEVHTLDPSGSKDQESTAPISKSPRKRKSDVTDSEPKRKRTRTKAPKSDAAASTAPNSPSKPSSSKPPKVTLKLGPKPQEPDVFPCALCVSSSRENLLPVHNPPVWQKEGQSGASTGAGEAVWYAHEECANVIPETWIDTMESESVQPDETVSQERMVFGTDAIPKDRWSLSADGDTMMETEEPQVLALVKKLEVELLCPQHNPVRCPKYIHSSPLTSSVAMQVKMEARKAAKQDRIRTALLSMPAMSRIKLRVSAGVFEVSLVRVVEETGSVEVLWDRGYKREFKWSSVVFGNTDNVVVGQKPTELAAEPERKTSRIYARLRIDNYQKVFLPSPLLPSPSPLLLSNNRQALRSTFH